MNVSAAILVVRGVVGLLFSGHGLVKLTRLGGGHGLSGTAGGFEQMGIRPGRFWALVAGAAELVGGLLFAVGLVTPLAALALVSVMVVAVVTVHWGMGLWITKGGFEYNLVLAAVAAAVGLFGPGSYSLDAVIGTGFTYPWAFVIGLIPVAVATLVATGHLPLSIPTSGNRQRRRAI